MKNNQSTLEITNSIKVLEEGGLLLYPTDIGWCIGCDATNISAIKKLFVLSELPKKHPLFAMVQNDAMLERYMEKVPDLAYDILDIASKPTILEYDQPKKLATALISSTNTTRIYVATSKFCQYLIGRFKKPLACTTANKYKHKVPKRFSEIAEPILSGVDYVVNLQEQEAPYIAPAIIALSLSGKVKVIRE